MFKLVTIVLLSTFIWSCSSQVAFSGKKKADVDSVLFYQQSNLSDSFIDSVLTVPGNYAQLSTVLTPPPPPRKTFEQIEGFRVQVFAGIDSSRAAIIKQDIHNLVTDSIYVVSDVGLFKVQLGDFKFRSKADSVQRLLTINGIKGSWVVRRLINLPISMASGDSVSSTPALSNDYKFKIQILATADENNAKQLLESLKSSFSHPAFYLHFGAVYKVYLGKFNDRDLAEKTLELVRGQGYPDAWLVY